MTTNTRNTGLNNAAYMLGFYNAEPGMREDCSRRKRRAADPGMSSTYRSHCQRSQEEHSANAAISVCYYFCDSAVQEAAAASRKGDKDAEKFLKQCSDGKCLCSQMANTGGKLGSSNSVFIPERMAQTVPDVSTGIAPEGKEQSFAYRN